MKKRAAGLLGVVMAAGALVQAAPASAGTTAPPPFCQLALGSTTSGGDLILRVLSGTVPPSAGASTWGGKDLMPDNQIKVAGGLGLQVNADQSGVSRRQYVVLGSTLNLLTYDVKGFSGEVDPASVKRTPVGGGWGDARYIENSRYNIGNKLARNSAYAVIGDNILRWTVDGTSFTRKATYAGFSAVKTMTLISQTATYDTFLANTRAGALYTIRIPVTGKPVVKVVRRTTWQGFDALVASKCGTGTMLLGVDKETGAPYLYTIGHANGTATVIKGLGKVPRTFGEVAYSRYYDDTQDYDQLSGE
ncbi:hypothetical protein [Kribbella jiaozuonensis]|uniref:Uncharacterized protein n=1 Tax=Kribbella jiaozuonensis TaxID=2575441 RepID=A0A4U3LHD9_9ACTN|nr:hypothetical protein [Kribbella jiaozuonensis]TKK73676.1 hypothetical protein FDA38_41075 [Kribbella jiaozuonensis]